MTRYLSEGTTNFTSDVSFSDVSVTGTAVFGGAVTLGGAVTASGAVTQSGALTVTGQLDASGTTLLVANSTSAASYNIIADGELTIVESTLSTATLVFRSGNTIYHWVSSQGST